VTPDRGRKAANTDPAFEPWLKDVSALPAPKQVEAVSKKLMELNPGFDGIVHGFTTKVPPTIQDGVVTEFGIVADNVTNILPVRAFQGLKSFHCGGSHRHPQEAAFSDLSPLKGMPLTKLCVWNTQVADLSPLRGMPLTLLRCGGTKVSNLSPLKRMKLTELGVANAPVADLSPLAGMSTLGNLALKNTNVTAAGVAALQEALPNCKIEWDEPARPTAPAKPLPAFETPAFQEWMKTVADLPADKKVEAVTKKLRELNPHFMGKVTPKISNGVVTELSFVTNRISDISPVRAFRRLKVLRISSGNADNKSNFSDLSPLRGIPLTDLDCSSTHVSHLSPLQDCKSLKSLKTKNTNVTPAGVAALKKALPKCKVEWDEPARPKKPVKP
jgi:hypothetical protein